MNSKQPLSLKKLLLTTLAVEGLLFSILSCGSDVERIQQPTSPVISPNEPPISIPIPSAVLIPIAPNYCFNGSSIVECKNDLAPSPSSTPTIIPTVFPLPFPTPVCSHNDKCKHDNDND